MCLNDGIRLITFTSDSSRLLLSLFLPLLLCLFLLFNVLLLFFVVVLLALFLLFWLFLDLLFLVFGSCLLIVHEESGVVVEQLFTSSQLTSLLLDLLLVFVAFFPLVGLLSYSPVLFPLEEHFIGHERA